MGDTYRIVAADDSVFMLNAIGAYLKDSEFELVGKATDGEMAIVEVDKQKPDIVLLDNIMPGKTGKDALVEIMESHPDTKVIMVSSLGTREAVEECIEAGAASFVKKPFSKDDLLGVMRAVVKGE